MSSGPFSGLLDKPSAITKLRAAAGIYVQNHNFRDVNVGLYQGNFTARDGATWLQSKFGGWFYVGSAPGDPYGNYAGARRPHGGYGAEAYYNATTSTATTQTISTNHTLLAISLHTDFLPLASVYNAHYDKAISLALLAQIPSDCTIGTNIKAYIACYDSSFSFITPGSHNGLTEANPAEMTFELDGEAGTGLWQRLLAHTSAVLPDNTVYVMLHIGMNSPDGANTGFVIGSARLMLNPMNADIAEAASPEYFIDMDPVKLHYSSAMGMVPGATQDMRMLDGRLVRHRMGPSKHLNRFSAFFHKTDVEALQKLMTMLELSVAGLGIYVPEPVPLCIDTGLGTQPWFSYYHVENAAAAMNFNPAWTLAGEGFDVGMTFLEA